MRRYWYRRKMVPRCRGSTVVPRNTSLDYANSLLYGTSATNIHKLQCAQNTLSRIVLSNSPYRHLSVNSRLAHLHWLPVDMRIKFKIATLTYKTLSTGQRTYLHDLLQPYIPSRSILSASQLLLHTPPLRTNFSRRSFRHAASTVWNEIPLTIRESGTLNTFKRRLKSHLFNNYS